MHKRLPSEDLDLVVTSIAISQSVGGNLAEVFDKIGETIRERRRVEGRIDSLTAQGKIQGIVVSLLPLVVGLAIYWIDPTLMAPLLNNVAGVHHHWLHDHHGGPGLLLHPQDREHRV